MFPRNVGSAWEIFAPAKLNLYLEVMGPPAEGFHPLETLMVPVRIFDQLRWTLDPSDALEPKLQIRNLLAKSDVPDGQLSVQADNLVLRAAQKLAHVAGVDPRGVFQLIKRIPIQAGLGGGSSDAAAALLLANAGWKIHYSRERLSRLAEDLGSDIPFFLGSGPAICRGRGERVEPITGLPRLHFVIVKPPVGLSTPEVFDLLRNDDQSTPEIQTASSARLVSLVEALRLGAVARAGQWMVNRLELAAEQLSPWVARLRGVFAQIGCLGYFLTGSGAAYVGVMRSALQARRVARSIVGMNLGSVFATSSC